MATKHETEADQELSIQKKTSYDLIHEEDVIIALKNDKGPTVVLKSFSIKDFTSKGDNYGSVISSVAICYTDDGIDKDTSYVVKLNPCRSEEWDGLNQKLFGKEIGFYTTLLPMLNAELKRINEQQLHVPNCLHFVKSSNEEVIYIEDLRTLGYKMIDRKKGMDKKHTELVIVEIARLHAASSLLMSRSKYQDGKILDKMLILKDVFDEVIYDDIESNMKAFVSGAMETAAKIAEKIPGHEKAASFLWAKKDHANYMLQDIFKVTEQFKLICYGDCWSNNVLFSYSADGEVEECRLLDFQLTRVGSPVLDLNYLIYGSLNSDVRRAELPAFLTKYYATFASVMAGGGVAMKFTLNQLEKEFRNKNAYGLIAAVLLAPLVLLNSEDTPDYESLVKDDLEKKAKYQNSVIDQVQNNPLLKLRFLDLFDEMIELGVIY